MIAEPCLKGRIHTLRGRSYFNCGLLTEAEECFDLTLKIMGYSFPMNLLAIRIKSYYLLKLLTLTMTSMRSCWVGSLQGDVAEYGNQFANCLANMFELFTV